MISSQDNKKTPLFDAHRTLKAKIVPFSGWMMPVSYTSVLQEHRVVREQCGLFDVSHMGELFVSGPKAKEFLQMHTINDVNRLTVGEGQYSALLNPQGGMIDDIIIYRLNSEQYLICVNASNINKDFEWLKLRSQSLQGVVVCNDSEAWCQLAIQGPNSPEVIKTLLNQKDSALAANLSYMKIIPVTVFAAQGWLARTGYTGEVGFELYLPAEVGLPTWNKLLETFPSSGIKPVGLGARDTLRLESCYLLYGNDMDDHTSPLEAGISWAVKTDKGEFVGRKALLSQKESGLNRLMFAFKMVDDGIPRHGMTVYTKDGEPLGVVTSGSVLPTLGGAGGLALLNPKKIKIGEEFFVDIRGTQKLAVTMVRPLYKAKVKV